MADVFDIESASKLGYQIRHIDNYDYSNKNNWSSEDISNKNAKFYTRENPACKSAEAVLSSDKLGSSLSPVQQKYSQGPSSKRNKDHKFSSKVNNCVPHTMSSEREGWHSPQHLQKQIYSQSATSQPFPQPPPSLNIYQHEVSFSFY